MNSPPLGAGVHGLRRVPAPGHGRRYFASKPKNVRGRGLRNRDGEESCGHTAEFAGGAVRLRQRVRLEEGASSLRKPRDDAANLDLRGGRAHPMDLLAVADRRAGRVDDPDRASRARRGPCPAPGVAPERGDERRLDVVKSASFSSRLDLGEGGRLQGHQPSDQVRTRSVRRTARGAAGDDGKRRVPRGDPRGPARRSSTRARPCSGGTRCEPETRSGGPRTTGPAVPRWAIRRGPAAPDVSHVRDD